LGRPIALEQGRRPNDDQWASVKTLSPERFKRIADVERSFGTTIKKGQTVEEMAWKA
jgi:hypothetical protein